jgi:hypothetical protein
VILMKSRFAIFLSMAVVLAVVASIVSGTMLAGAQGQVPATGNIAVRGGSQPGEVIISWDAVPEATHYRIGYVNMETDYLLAKASRTGNWLEAFVYVDVEAQNFTVVGGRTEYTVRRLAQGVRHAFTVRTSDNIDGAFTWPSNPRWRFHVVSDRGGACPTVTPVPTPEPAEDRAALVALYNATGGADWTDDTNWLGDGPVGEWYGVTADDGGRVTRLSLRENDLTGTIPSVLGRLTSLERLDLQGNDLTGSIPGELVNLNNLQRLDLDYNQLTGALPSWLGNLGNLQILDLNDNLLTGEPDRLRQHGDGLSVGQGQPDGELAGGVRVRGRGGAELQFQPPWATLRNWNSYSSAATRSPAACLRRSSTSLTTTSTSSVSLSAVCHRPRSSVPPSWKRCLMTSSGRPNGARPFRR